MGDYCCSYCCVWPAWSMMRWSLLDDWSVPCVGALNKDVMMVFLAAKTWNILQFWAKLPVELFTYGILRIIVAWFVLVNMAHHISIIFASLSQRLIWRYLFWSWDIPKSTYAGFALNASYTVLDRTFVYFGMFLINVSRVVYLWKRMVHIDARGWLITFSSYSIDANFK